MKKYNYSYSQFLQDIYKAKDILQNQNISAIVAVARGGLTLSHFLANILNIRAIYSVNSVSYDKDKRLKNIELFGLPHLHNEKGILIVDDIADSGRTLREITRILNREYPEKIFFTFTLFYKNSSNFEPDYYLHTVEDIWIDFFWETL